MKATTLAGAMLVLGLFFSTQVFAEHIENRPYGWSRGKACWKECLGNPPGLEKTGHIPPGLEEENVLSAPTPA
jgi:hypothetical protein